MNKLPLIFITLVVIAGLILSACASQGTSAGLTGTSWKLVSYGPVGKQTPAAAGIQTSLDFGKDGRVSGNMGCNSFGGNYQVRGGNIVFSQIVSTMMACQGPQMDQEGATLKVMNGTAHFQLDGNMLTIYAASGDNAITLSR